MLRFSAELRISVAEAHLAADEALREPLRGFLGLAHSTQRSSTRRCRYRSRLTVGVLNVFQRCQALEQPARVSQGVVRPFF